MPTSQPSTDQPPLFYVEVKGDELDGRRFSVGGDGLLVGRSPTCDVIFESREVSRRHCYLYPDGDSCFVKDLGSRNGISVNGKPTKDRRLVNGDAVEVGPSRLLLHVEGRPQARGEAEAVPDLMDRQPPDFAPPRHPLAIAGIIFAVLAYLHWSFGLAAALLVLLSLYEGRRQPDRLGRSLAVGALLIAAVGGGMNLWFAEAAPMLREKDQLAGRIECRDNLLGLGAALAAYRAAHGGALPERLGELISEDLAEPERLRCPAGEESGEAECRYLFVARSGAASVRVLGVVACDPGLDCHQQDGGWLLMADGHTEWMPHERFARILAEVQAAPLAAAGEGNRAGRQP